MGVRLLSMFFATTVLGCSWSVAKDEVASCVELLGRAGEYRHSSLRSARIVILEKTLDSIQNTEFHFTVTLDNDQRKVSRKSRVIGSTTWAGPDQFVFNDKEYLEDTGASKDIVVTIESRFEEDEPGSRRFAFDPRSLGMCFGGSSAMGQDGISAFVPFFDGHSDESTVTESDLDGMDTLLLERKFVSESSGKREQFIRVWLAPQYGYSIVAAELSDGENGRFLTSELKQYEAGIWFPTSVTYREKTAGSVTKEKTLSVLEAKFNVAVDPSEFSVKGLNLKKGRRVSVATNGIDFGYEWSGTDLVPLGKRPAVKDLPKRAELSWFIVGNIILLIALGAFGFSKAFARRSQ
jgi:hypothetical protein